MNGQRQTEKERQIMGINITLQQQTTRTKKSTQSFLQIELVYDAVQCRPLFYTLHSERNRQKIPLKGARYDAGCGFTLCVCV